MVLIFSIGNKKLARDTTCIKKVFIDMNNKLNFPKNTYIWLFYIPLVYKNKIDFKKAIKLVEKKKLKSICSFIPAKSSHELLEGKKR